LKNYNRAGSGESPQQTAGWAGTWKRHNKSLETDWRRSVRRYKSRGIM